MPRNNMAVRWYEKNLLCLCSGCHMFFAHQQVIEFAEFVKQFLGEEEYDKLRLKARYLKRWSYDEMLVLYYALKKNKWG